MNNDESITQNDYNDVKSIIDTIKAVARVTYKSIYVIDYVKKRFLYVSGNPLFLCDHTPQEVNEIGFDFYNIHVPIDEQPIFLELNQKGYCFFENIPIDERYHYSIVYDLHLKSERKSAVLVNHKLTPIRLTPSGHIWLAVCIVSLSSNKEAGHMEIRKENSSVYWELGCPI